jgi:hypothetical protein
LRNRIISELPVYLIYIVLFSATVSYPFFWDTIQLASEHATFFYNSGFSSIILPNEIDSGHIPSLGIYLAAVWKIFGRTLIVSHLAMLPFVAGIVYQVLRLSRKLFSGKWYPLAALIILIDPTLLAQSTMVSPDVILVFFFLLAVNSLLSGNRTFLSLALAGLTLASMRGMMCAGALFIVQVILISARSKTASGSYIPRKPLQVLIRTIISWLPAFLLAASFFAWHYIKTGWIGYHENMPWSDLFEPAGLKGSLFNIFILGWRLADFGRLFVWIAGAACFWHWLRNRPPLDMTLIFFITAYAVFLLILGGTLIFHKNLSGHRYLLPLYILFTVSVLYYLFNTGDALPRKFLAALMIAGLVSGNFWVYPDRIAKGWDSTLAYLPYFPLRQKMMTFMEQEGISASETGSAFPNNDKFDHISLNGNKQSFAERDFTTNRYILWSNIYNDFSDEELGSLENWIKLRELKTVQVRMVLYKNPGLK